MDNVVTCVYAKSGGDRLWNVKALADRKSDNNNKKKNNNNNNVVAIGDPFLCPKIKVLLLLKIWTNLPDK